MKQKAYARAGVDIDLGNKVKRCRNCSPRRIGAKCWAKSAGLAGCLPWM
jgi:hypothetical protein